MADKQRYYNIQLDSAQSGSPIPVVKVCADGITGGEHPGVGGAYRAMTLTLDGNIVATFSRGRVLGWWVSEEEVGAGEP